MEFFDFLPGIVAAPLVYIFRRQQNYSKTVDQHTIEINNQKEQIEKHDKKFYMMCDKLDVVTAELHELNGTLREHLRKGD
jgi:hypothetical protein